MICGNTDLLDKYELEQVKMDNDIISIRDKAEQRAELISRLTTQELIKKDSDLLMYAFLDSMETLHKKHHDIENPFLDFMLTKECDYVAHEMTARELFEFAQHAANFRNHFLKMLEKHIVDKLDE